MTTAIAADLEQDDLLRHIASLSIPSAEEQKRRALVSRLACMLQEISEKFPGNTVLVDEAMGWRSHPDFEQRLDEWEAGDHPALRG